MSSTKDGEYEEKNRVSSHRGYCYKMRRSHNLLAPQWGKRWFSIEGRYLRWYRQESDISPSGMVDLRHVRSITKVDINGAYTFCVTCEDRNLIMRANTLSEMNSWFRALHRHADLARGGDGTNVVSDFNEAPLRSKNVILSSAKNNKGRNRLTLEEEIDLNLQKLNELEIEVSTPVPDFVIEEKVGDKFEATSDNSGDFHYSQQQQSINYSKHSQRPAAHYNNPMAEPPVAYRPQVAKKVPQPKTAPIFKPDFVRSISNESESNIESAVFDTRRAVDTSRAIGLSKGNQGPTVASLQKKPSSHARRSNHVRVEDEFSDEFDISLDSTSPSHSNGTHRYNTNANANSNASFAKNERGPSRYKHSENENNQTLVRRFHDDDEDEEEEERAPPLRADNNRSDVNPMSHQSSRNSRARAAWN